MRKRSRKADIQMEAWLRTNTWTKLYTRSGAEDMAEAFVRAIEAKMDELYPWKKISIKSTDPPWMTGEIKRKIRSRKRTYGKEKRSTRWHVKKEETKKTSQNCQKSYYDRFVHLAKTTNNPGLYYKAVSRLKSREAPRPFSPCDIFPSSSEAQVAEKTADFFYKNS